MKGIIIDGGSGDSLPVNTVVEIIGFVHDTVESFGTYAVCKGPQNRILRADIRDIKLDNEPIQQSNKEAYILFEGTCKMQGMIALNNNRLMNNESMAFTYKDFVELSEEVRGKLEEVE